MSSQLNASEKQSRKTYYPVVLVILLTLMFGLVSTPARAATITVCSSGCDYTTIQAAIDAAATGDTINIGPGIYSPGATLNINKTISFVGAEQTTTIIDAAGMPASSYGFLVTASNVTLQNFTLRNAKSYGLKIQGNISNVTIQQVTVQNSARSNIDFNGVDNITVTQVTLTGALSGVGLAISDGNGADLSYITTSGNAWAGMAVYTSSYYPPAGSSSISLSGVNSFGELVPFYTEPKNPGDPITNINVTADFHWTTRTTTKPTTTVYFPTLTAAKTASEAIPANIPISAIYDLDQARFFIPYKATAPAYTIQAAVNLASAQDTIWVEAGTYTEQVKIGKSLNLVGPSGAAATTIQAPATIAPSSSITSTIIDINGTGVNVELTGFTIAGPGPSGCGSIGAGIFVRGEANANIHDNRIKDIRDQSFSGCQNGIGILVGRASFSTVGTATIAHNIVEGYQKNGIVVSNSGSSATITANTVTGVGPTTVIAQNGIQISSGATAVITNNIISAHSYTPFSYVSAGILLYGSNTDTSGNQLDQNQVGIYHIEGSGLHNGNRIGATRAGTGSPGFWGIIVDAPPPGHQPAPFDAELVPQPVVETPAQASLLAAATQAVVVTNNELTGDSTNAGIGLEADAGYGALDIDLTATNNIIRDWGTGVMIFECASACTDSIFTHVDVSLNSLTGNLTGLINSSDFSVEATRNWWGSQTGPTHPGNTDGTGNSVGTSVTFSPWLCLGTDTSAAIGFQPDLATLCAIPTHLVFTVQPGNSMVNHPLTPQPLVRAEDAFGNLGFNFNGPVTLTFNPNGTSLNGANPVNAVNGVVTFSDLSVDTAGTYTLNASTSGLSAATSDSFTISQPSSPANQILFLPIISKF